MRVFERVLIRVLKQRETRKPSISEMYAAGSLLGLDENDVRRLGRFNMTSRLKDFLGRSFLLFLFSLLAVIAIVLIISWIVPNPWGQRVYPLYGVTNRTLLKDRIFPI